MDIHKPKPIHSLREFIKEVGIIVLGVSIALTALDLTPSEKSELDRHGRL